VKFLVDAAVLIAVAEGLRQHGHDATPVRDYGLQAAEDETIFAPAKREDRVVVSADTDFGTLLALTGEREPSVLLFRRGTTRVPARQLALLVTNLAVIQGTLQSWSIVVLDGTRIRVQSLPIRQ
jgi:predicted nuclease of predicted toxin-antitoxin system